MFGQTATGNIVGRVTDSSGGVIGGVTVTALNPEKGLTFKTVTDSEGVYRFYYLAPATYTVTLHARRVCRARTPGRPVAIERNPVSRRPALGR